MDKLQEYLIQQRIQIIQLTLLKTIVLLKKINKYLTNLFNKLRINKFFKINYRI